MLGAAGVNLGTRFIASTEAPAPNEWKEAITAAQSEDAIKVEVLNDIESSSRHGGFRYRAALSAYGFAWMSGAPSARRRVANMIDF